MLDTIRKLFTKSVPYMVGIDIGSHSVKAVLLSEQHGVYRVEEALVEPMPKGMIKDSEIQDIEAVARVVNKIRKQIPKSIKHAAVAISGSSVITKVIYMDVTLSDSELESQIEIEADSLIPYPLDEVSLDFEKIAVNKADPSKIDILLSAARTENIEARSHAVNEGGFEPKVLDVESYALSRAGQLCIGQLPDDADKKVVAFIDVGSQITLLSIIEGERSLYTRDQVFGGEQFTNSIVSYYGRSFEESEKAKVNGDLPPNYTFEVLAPFQTALLQQIRRSIQMFLNTSEKDNVDYIVLSGGTSLISGLDRLLIDELGIHTVIAKPFAELEIAAELDSEDIDLIQSQLMIATGLALRSFSQCHI
ncbi:pilus assembly protein PilM [Psychrosphaera haliotis]|uniref:Type IV pilus assembly protein PilM n=1 Tax=Psychrosphaera haliotis TaxID=555083 RepID=A0A6N8FC74_9GAMM|nr:pilus assembly protein PilM [Psychrosphaera haliotis]MUH73139.1 type IV pilus assembly protein PilM [Psychrosphaera haliotis]